MSTYHAQSEETKFQQQTNSFLRTNRQKEQKFRCDGYFKRTKMGPSVLYGFFSCWFLTVLGAAAAGHCHFYSLGSRVNSNSCTTYIYVAINIVGYFYYYLMLRVCVVVVVVSVNFFIHVAKFLFCFFLFCPAPDKDDDRDVIAGDARRTWVPHFPRSPSSHLRR